MDDQSQTPSPNPSSPPPANLDWREQRRQEHMARREARQQRHDGLHSPLIAGTILVLLGVVFLFNLDFGLFWPVLLILGGLALLMTSLVRA